MSRQISSLILTTIMSDRATTVPKSTGLISPRRRLSSFRTACLRRLAILSRRSFSLLAAGTVLCVPNSGSAQAYPERSVRMLIGFPAGGTVDTIGRIIGPALSIRLAQTVVIENRGGAAGSLAVEAAARAQPDGYTIVFASAGALVIVPHMQSNLRYDPFKDLAAICRVVGTPMVLVVGKHVAVNSVQELQKLARANPGKLTFGS